MVDITGVSEAAVGETITFLDGLPDKTDGLNEMLEALRNSIAPKEEVPPA